VQEPPKIEFPCPGYPIKVLGEAGDTLYSLVMAVMDEHAPGFDRSRTTVKDSGKGRFQSVTVYITATGVEQLETIHQALRANPVTKVVL
jgi:putative lipoic acid-binding regulatory protein